MENAEAAYGVHRQREDTKVAKAIFITSEYETQGKGGDTLKSCPLTGFEVLPFDICN